MKIYLRHTRDEKVMNLVKNSTDKHAICNSDVFEMETPSEYTRTHVHAILILWLG